MTAARDAVETILSAEQIAAALEMETQRDVYDSHEALRAALAVLADRNAELERDAAEADLASKAWQSDFAAAERRVAELEKKLLVVEAMDTTLTASQWEGAYKEERRRVAELEGRVKVAEDRVAFQTEIAESSRLHWLAMASRNEELEARVAKLTGALREADDLLRRLSEWDVLNLAPGSGDDGPYWQGEIARVRAEFAAVGGEADGPRFDRLPRPEDGYMGNRDWARRHPAESPADDPESGFDQGYTRAVGGEADGETQP